MKEGARGTSNLFLANWTEETLGNISKYGSMIMSDYRDRMENSSNGTQSFLRGLE